MVLAINHQLVLSCNLLEVCSQDYRFVILYGSLLVICNQDYRFTYSPGYKPPVGYKTKPPTHGSGYKPPVGYKIKPPSYKQSPGYKSIIHGYAPRYNPPSQKTVYATGYKVQHAKGYGSLSVTCCKRMVFSCYFGFIHHYKLNIDEH
jgi:hypothetical protein